MSLTEEMCTLHSEKPAEEATTDPFSVDRGCQFIHQHSSVGCIFTLSKSETTHAFKIKANDIAQNCCMTKFKTDDMQNSLFTT